VNRIIKATAKLLCKLKDIDNENIKALRKIIMRLESVSDIELGQTVLNKIRLSTSNRSYRFILELCKLIYNSLTVSSESGDISLSSFFDDTLLKSQIFEKFVKNFYVRNLTNLKVGSLKFKWSIGSSSDETFKSRVPELRTDVVIDTETSRLIIDAKYYAEALKQSFGGRLKYRRDHLSQLMEYLRTSLKETMVPTAGLLLYPAVNADINDRGQIEGYDIRVSTIDLSKDWSEIERKMLGLLANVSNTTGLAA